MWMVLWLVTLIVLAGQTGSVRTWDFDQMEAGRLPEGWRVEATGQEKADAATAFDNFTVIPR
jgi:hypothetical protein